MALAVDVDSSSSAASRRSRSRRRSTNSDVNTRRPSCTHTYDRRSRSRSTRPCHKKVRHDEAVPSDNTRKQLMCKDCGELCRKNGVASTYFQLCHNCWVLQGCPSEDPEDVCNRCGYRMRAKGPARDEGLCHRCFQERHPQNDECKLCYYPMRARGPARDEGLCHRCFQDNDELENGICKRCWYPMKARGEARDYGLCHACYRKDGPYRYGFLVLRPNGSC